MKLQHHFPLPIPQIRARNPYEIFRLQKILDGVEGTKNPSLKVISAIGEGTFSTVYLAYPKHPKEEDATPQRSAVKHIIPTSSPDRILTEVDCLRQAGGRHNVIPLLFCYRIGGDVVLVMPYIRPTKFSELVKVIDLWEMINYIQNLLVAMAHIHKLNIIHRDIKPANFLYDRERQQFGLVDFGLAQQVGEPAPKKASEIFTSRKRLGSSELAAECSPEKQSRQRDPLSNKTNTPESLRQQKEKGRSEHRQRSGATRGTSSEKTPDKSTLKSREPPLAEHYNARGSLKKSPVGSLMDRKYELNPTETAARKKAAMDKQKAVVTPRF